MLVQYLIFLGLLIASFILFFRVNKRSAQILFEDLFFDDENDYINKTKNINPLKIKSSKFIIGDELAEAGLVLEEKRRRFLELQKLIPIFTITFFGLISLALKLNVALFIVVAVASFSLSFIYTKQRLRNKKKNYISELEYNLPLVMEKIVMAVEAGLDVISALHTIVDLDESSNAEDPCSVISLFKIVIKITESGLQFEKALSLVALSVPSSSLKHAFIYLGNAQRDGGELIMPLRELSDATQAYFQESIEVEVAKAPVKATLPLIFTFIGLIICFLTIPIIQIVETLNKSDFSPNTQITIDK